MTLFRIFVNSVQTEFIQEHESLRLWLRFPFSAAYLDLDRETRQVIERPESQVNRNQAGV